MRKRCFILAALAGMFLIGAGCAEHSRFCAGPTTFCRGPSRLELDYGTSFKLAKFNQVWDPEAEKNPEPVTGFDGKAAQKTVERYRKDFEKPAPPPTYVLGVGSIGVGSGTGR